MSTGQEPERRTFHTDLRDFEIRIFKPDFLGSLPFNQRIEYLTQVINTRAIVILSGGIGSLYVGTNQYASFDRPGSKLRLLVTSLPECCGCFLRRSELVKLNIPDRSVATSSLEKFKFFSRVVKRRSKSLEMSDKQSVLVAPVDIFNHVAKTLKVSAHEMDVIRGDLKRRWKRDITDIRNMMQLKIAMEKAPDSPAQTKEGQVIVTLYKPKNEAARLIFRDALKENQYLQFQFSMLHRIVGTIELIKRGKLVYNGPEHEEKDKLQALLSLRQEIEDTIDNLLHEEEIRQIAYGKSVGEGVAGLHALNSIHGDLHRDNIIYPLKDSPGISLIDLDETVMLLRELDETECAGDIVTLLTELSSVEWSAFKQAYISKRGEKGKKVINLLESEWTALTDRA